MTVDNIREVKHLIDVSDLATKVASLARQYRSGYKKESYPLVDKAIEFIDEAKNGGGFVQGQTENLHQPKTLEPLEWSTDIYGQQHETTENLYADVVSYLKDIEAALRDLKAGTQNPRNLDEVVVFFSALGRLLGIRAEANMYEENERRGYWSAF